MPRLERHACYHPSMTDPSRKSVHPTAQGPSAEADADLSLRRSERHSEEESARIRQFVIEAAKLASDRHCEEVLIIDVRGLSSITDYILIASGTSDRQIAAVGKEIAEMGREYDVVRIGTDRDDDARWLVLDFVDVVAHLFDPELRAYYDLEMLWGDGQRVNWRQD